MEKEIIIGGAYRIVSKLGEGGGGVVYKGEHLRLRKAVVLKEDRRSLRNHPEDRLRREVDALKNLHHTYLPQVYDFVPDREQGVVYTVIDYIDGVSLDKPLSQGIRFPQRRVIRWARQLLEALIYLHSRPPHGILHADIKPANIMLVSPEKNIMTENPAEEIRLIDFNIALFLKEDGAVRVGYSDGYASPEHYGLDYSNLGVTQADTGPETVAPDDPARTVLPTGPRMTAASNGVLLDVRSDIYSLGATLYHFLTGEFPNPDATSVRPISTWTDISTPVAQIIEKAMNPNPNLRYQTADEMLRAFLRLHPDDPRTRRHRRRAIAVGVLSAVLFLTGGMMSFVGLKRNERTQSALVQVEYSANALRRGDVAGAVEYALEALPQGQGLLYPPPVPQAKRALANALGVYDLSDGYRPHGVIELPNAPGKTGLSPDGTRTAALTGSEGGWTFQIFDTESGEKLLELPSEQSALSDFLFLDSDTLLYAGAGGPRVCTLPDNETVWASSEPASTLALSADGQIAAAANRDGTGAVLYRTDTGEILQRVDFEGKRLWTAGEAFADPDASIFALNADGTWLAASFADGGLELYHLRDDDTVLVLSESSDFVRFEGGFSRHYFAYTAAEAIRTYFGVFDLDIVWYTVESDAERLFHVQADETGVYLSIENGLSEINPDPTDVDQVQVRELAHPDAEIADFDFRDGRILVKTVDGVYAFYDESGRRTGELRDENRVDFLDFAGDWLLTANRDLPELVLRKYQRDAGETAFVYDPAYSHREARVNADRTTALLYRNDSLRVIDREGTVLAETPIPDPDGLRDQQYRRGAEGEYLELFYLDGRRSGWDAKTGGLLWEVQEALNDSLDETFETEDYYITAPLRGTPVIYRAQDRTPLRELDAEGNLVYAEQRNGYLILFYITARGERTAASEWYGRLLDENLDTVADLPNLCDVLPDGTLVFDDRAGNLRTSRIYSIEDLLSLAQQTKRRNTDA